MVYRLLNSNKLYESCDVKSAFFIFIVDDDNLISLELISDVPQCQNIYVNASYINVSLDLYSIEYYK